VGDEEARSNHGLGYVDALDGPLSDGGSIPPASILEPLVIPAVLFFGRADRGQVPGGSVATSFPRPRRSFTPPLNAAEA